MNSPYHESAEEELVRAAAESPELPAVLRRQVLCAALQRERRRTIRQQACGFACLFALIIGLQVWIWPQPSGTARPASTAHSPAEISTTGVSTTVAFRVAADAPRPDIPGAPNRDGSRYARDYEGSGVEANIRELLKRKAYFRAGFGQGL